MATSQSAIISYVSLKKLAVWIVNKPKFSVFNLLFLNGSLFVRLEGHLLKKKKSVLSDFLAVFSKDSHI